MRISFELGRYLVVRRNSECLEREAEMDNLATWPEVLMFQEEFKLCAKAGLDSF